MKNSPRTEETLAVSAEVRIPAGHAQMEGELKIPAGADGVVLFAHGSGSGRHSPRNQHVARVIRASCMGTLLFDLLTRQEEIEDNLTARLRFDIGLLARRLAAATRWLAAQSGKQRYGMSYFGASTGGGAALVAAAGLGKEIDAIVSRGGRPDLAGAALSRVASPTLLIAGEYDEEVIRLNEAALTKLRCEKAMKIVPRAGHLFEESGTLDEVARLAVEWFQRHLRARTETEQ